MKENESEKLYLSLSEIGDDLLREAEEADAGEKRNPGKKEGKTLMRKAVAAMAACLAVVLILSVTLPKRKERLPEWIAEAQPELFPGAEEGPDAIHITCFDEVNYYGAKLLLMKEAGIALGGKEKAGKTAVRPAPTLSFRFLSASKEDRKKEDKDIYYYEIDPNENFEIRKIIAFRIFLADPEGFLAQKLGGAGYVDVIVTDSNLEAMITFHANGLYYTCLLNGGGSSSMQFSTHKYIEGFHIVKNFEQTNYFFEFDITDGRVNNFRCGFFKQINENPGYPADTAMIVNDSDCIRNVKGSFTVSELEGILRRFPAETGKNTEVLPGGGRDSEERPPESIPVRLQIKQERRKGVRIP